ncbi:hypothetical protein D3C79_763440 [compost metagenome]
MGQQRGNRRRACGTGADDDEAARIAVTRWLGVRQRLVIDPDFAILDPCAVTAQVCQGRRLADHAFVHGERGLVPGADQQAVAYHALFQRRSGVRAIGLVGADLPGAANQDHFFAAGLYTQGMFGVQLI